MISVRNYQVRNRCLCSQTYKLGLDPGGGGGGEGGVGILWISIDRDDRMGGKSKPQNIP